MKTKLFIYLLVWSVAFSFSQTKVADTFFDNYAYVKASELYEQAVNDGDESIHVLTRLGDCYYNNSNSQKASIWYKRAFDKNINEIDSEYLFKYIQTQRSLGNYNEAETWIKVFKERQRSDNRVASEITDLSIYNTLASTERVYVDIVNLDLNTAYSDFGGYEYNGRMYFASTRPNENTNNKKLYTWNEQPFLDIYETSVSETNGLKEHGPSISIAITSINTDFHESTIAITNDGKTIYFTRDNLNKRNKLDADKKGTTHLKIYKASYNNEVWKNIEELPFNSDDYSNGHPALSPDNTKLYFVSDRLYKGMDVQTDIYVVDILDGGNDYSVPKNLGSSVNTSGREMFPFIAKDSTFYFSSDGFINLGLLDIYKSNILKASNEKPINLGAPFNSGNDDFAFYVNSETETGYFSSNRDQGKGNDDIYSFSSYECAQTVSGVVRDKQNNLPVALATVELINEDGKIINRFNTDLSGSYSFEVACVKNYSVRASKPDYDDDVQSFTTTTLNKDVHTVDLLLDCPLCEIPCEIVINPIYFDFDKWNIRTDSKVDLELIVDIMRNHPKMKITIESHTDRRGSFKYNDKLSQKRALSTRDYIVSRGIPIERIVSAQGFGERQLLISNEAINAMASRKEKEVAHQKNRRSYFKIVNCNDN